MWCFRKTVCQQRVRKFLNSLQLSNKLTALSKPNLTSALCCFGSMFNMHNSLLPASQRGARIGLQPTAAGRKQYPGDSYVPSAGGWKSRPVANHEPIPKGPRGKAWPCFLSLRRRWDKTFNVPLEQRKCILHLFRSCVYSKDIKAFNWCLYSLLTDEKVISNEKLFLYFLAMVASGEAWRWPRPIMKAAVGRHSK